MRWAPPPRSAKKAPYAHNAHGLPGIAGLQRRPFCVASSLTAGPFKSAAAEPACRPCERETGHKVIIENDTAGGLAKRIKGGEAFDEHRRAAAGDAVAAGRTFNKVVRWVDQAVRRRSASASRSGKARRCPTSAMWRPSNEHLAAGLMAYIDPAAGGTSGVSLAQLFDKMGIGAELKPKSVLVPGGLVAEPGWCAARRRLSLSGGQARYWPCLAPSWSVSQSSSCPKLLPCIHGGIGAGHRDPAAAARVASTMFSDKAVAALGKDRGNADARRARSREHSIVLRRSRWKEISDTDY